MRLMVKYKRKGRKDNRQQLFTQVTFISMLLPSHLINAIINPRRHNRMRTCSKEGMRKACV